MSKNQKCLFSKMSIFKNVQNQKWTIIYKMFRFLKLVIFLDNGLNSIMFFSCLSRSEKNSGRKFTNI